MVTVGLDFQNILMSNVNTRTYSKTHHVFIMLNFYLEMVLNPNEWTDFQTVNASESFQGASKVSLPLTSILQTGWKTGEPNWKTDEPNPKTGKPNWKTG